jgi:imidazolonepropionase-like amidohydrolase
MKPLAGSQGSIDFAGVMEHYRPNGSRGPKGTQAMAAGTLIENGNVIDGTGAPARLEAVMIEGDSITAMGDGAIKQCEGRNDIDRIDATGMTVMPGLIDAHCHITFDEPTSNDELFNHRDREGLAAIIAAANARKLLLAGVTGIFDADSIFLTGIDLRDAIEAGVVEGPRMATGGNALVTSVGGTAGSMIPDEGRRGYAMAVRGKDEIIAEVRREIKAGADWIKVHVTGLIPRHRDRGEMRVWSDEELDTLVKAAHDLGVPVVGHCRGGESTAAAAKAGFDMILHATVMDDYALEEVVKAKVALVPTFTFQANLAQWGDKVGSDAGLKDVFEREIADSARTLRAAYDAGVPLLCGSESGFALTPYGEWHHREMDIFIKEFGLTPLQAIQCGTQAGAFALGLEGKVGVVGEGMLADVIVVDGDPLADINVLGEKSRLKHVFTGGRPVDLTRQPAPRRPISGWRVSSFADRILTQDIALAGKDG